MKMQANASQSIQTVFHLTTSLHGLALRYIKTYQF